MKTSEIQGAALDWAVARAAGWEPTIISEQIFLGDDECNPSTNWAQGGPIIEREKISTEYMAGAGDAGADVWVATRIVDRCFAEESGSTALIAAMRCYVVSKLGHEVELPKELT